MLTLAAIDAELDAIRQFARRFSLNHGVLLCDQRTPTDDEAFALKAKIARADVLMRAAERLRRTGGMPVRPTTPRD